jgi:hypothetical protein
MCLLQLFWGGAQPKTDTNSCVILFSVDKSLTSLAHLKQRITEEVTKISPEMVYTRKRAIKLVVCKGEALEERKARCGIKL